MDENNQAEPQFPTPGVHPAAAGANMPAFRGNNAARGFAPWIDSQGWVGSPLEGAFAIDIGGRHPERDPS
jgi:hypothetical protein